jgi:hypothetical protein
MQGGSREVHSTRCRSCAGRNARSVVPVAGRRGLSRGDDALDEDATVRKEWLEGLLLGQGMGELE